VQPTPPGSVEEENDMFRTRFPQSATPSRPTRTSSSPAAGWAASRWPTGCAQLDGARITLVDGKEEHNYQPGYTLVATGVWPERQGARPQRRLPPRGRGLGAGGWPSSTRWRTPSSPPAAEHRYDFLVVATGLHLDYAQIEGMDVAAIGRNGLASVYPARGGEAHLAGAWMPSARRAARR
jgi:hypothetical protein